jgi:hypothetical protein
MAIHPGSNLVQEQELRLCHEGPRQPNQSQGARWQTRRSGLPQGPHAGQLEHDLRALAHQPLLLPGTRQTQGRGNQPGDSERVRARDHVVQDRESTE